MPDIYKVWLHIICQSPEEEFEDIGEPIDLDCDFEGFEEADACRDMLLEVYNTMSTYIIKTYAPVYAKVEQLEQKVSDAEWAEYGDDL